MNILALSGAFEEYTEVLHRLLLDWTFEVDIVGLHSDGSSTRAYNVLNTTHRESLQCRFFMARDANITDRFN